MSGAALSSRAVQGMYFERLSQPSALGWMADISTEMQSDQAQETYVWLGMTPAMTRWQGQRTVKRFTSQQIVVPNLHFESSLHVDLVDLRRDKTGQLAIRIAEQVERAQQHWLSLGATLLLAGETTVCYDGDYFYGTAHGEGASGTQANLITVDISELPVTNKGSTTAPSVAQMREVILAGVAKLYSFLDDQGQPLNETAKNFKVVANTTLMPTVMAAITAPFVDGGDTNIIPAARNNISITGAFTPRFNSLTDSVDIFCTDGAVKPVIRQSETDVMLKVLAEGSDYEVNNDGHFYGLDAWRNVAFGRWQKAVRARMI
ncbi:MAG: Mu-like prophage major head subunit gpT family protein [Vicinamibacterales bacterium]